MAGQNPATRTPHRYPTPIAHEANRSTTIHATLFPPWSSPLSFLTKYSNWSGIWFSMDRSIAKKSWATPSSKPSGISTHEILLPPGGVERRRWMNSGTTTTGSSPRLLRAEANVSMGVTCPSAGYGTSMILLGLFVYFIFFLFLKWREEIILFLVSTSFLWKKQMVVLYLYRNLENIYRVVLNVQINWTNFLNK